MKQLIRIEVPNEEGEVQCFNKHGGFFSALGALYAIWRYGSGAILIGKLAEEPDMPFQEKEGALPLPGDKKVTKRAERYVS